MKEVAVLVERYPSSPASPLVRKLVRELTAIEEKIAHGRSFFNDTVTEYDTYVCTLPQLLVARLTGHRPQRGLRLRERIGTGDGHAYRPRGRAGSDTRQNSAPETPTQAGWCDRERRRSAPSRRAARRTLGARSAACAIAAAAL